jgi:2',3'-cyclic-nucleotide 2'-phosphodiesterase (5'-nucleotidase family)
MKKSLTILQINDLHGYIEPHPEIVRSADGDSFQSLGGLSRIAALYRKVREETSGAVLALDNGDTFHGTYVAVHSKGQALVPLMNALQLDAMTVHWEFAYGPHGLSALAAQLNYPVLAINVFDKATDRLLFPPYGIFDRGGLKIGVIGLACPIVDKTMPPSYSEGIRFSVGNEELPGWIERLKGESVDLIVVLSHLGFPQDVCLAREVGGIDVLVSGHTHNRMYEPVIENGAIIFQSGCHGSFVGRLDISVEDRRIVGHRHRLIAVDESLGDDADMRVLIDSAAAPHRDMLSEIVGHTHIPLHRYSMYSTAMDDLLLDAIAAAADTEIAFSNGWRYGAPIEPGPITMNDLWNIIPTNPPVSTVDLTGVELVAMIEENLERTFSANPYDQMGGFVKRCRGLTLYLKSENPKDHRIDRLFVLDAPVVAEKSYRCAFVTSQGVPAKWGCNRVATEVRAIEALRRWLETHIPGEEPARLSVRAV